MNRTLIEMRHGARNYLAVALAIILGVAFATATMLAGTTLERSTWVALASQFDGADAIITVESGTIDEATLATVREVDGVASAEGRVGLITQVTAGTRQTYPIITGVPDAAAMRDEIDVEDGRLPEASGEIALFADEARRLDVTVGGTIDVHAYTLDEPATVTVTGIIDGETGFANRAPTVYGWTGDVAFWKGSGTYDALMVIATDGTSDDELVDDLNAVLGPDIVARTWSQQATMLANSVTGDARILSTGLLAFAVIALFVASIVIANTFTILVAQRTRSLALLRTIGATRSQVRRSVLAEAFVLGTIASVIGVVVGIILAFGGIRIASQFETGRSLTTDLVIPIRAIIVPFVLGVIVTMIAAWGPASAATRVSPLAALRPMSVEPLRSRASGVRIAFSAAGIVGGGLIMALAVTLATASAGVMPLLLGMLGGMISAIGVLIGAVVIVPRVVGVMGGIVARIGGASATLAAANSTRNPRRTTATAMALLVAVTLVTMMSVGAASVKTTLNTVIDERDPIDFVVTTATWTGDTREAIPMAVDQTLANHPDVTESMPVYEALILTDDYSGMLLGVDPEAARRVLRAPSQLERLQDGTVLVPDDGSFDGIPTVTITVDGVARTFAVAPSPMVDGGEAIVTLHDLQELTTDMVPSRRWVRLADDIDAGEAVGSVQDALGGIGDIWYGGGAEAKAQNAQVLDMMLLVVTALLGVAVIIALVGVGNTLSLSVIERQRESAILRAIGLTRRQLRAMLALEGMLIAVVGALLGIVLGIIYGFAGVLTLLGTTWGVSLTVPPGRIGLIVAIALLAGMIASVVPARRAAQTAPVAALAE